MNVLIARVRVALPMLGVLLVLVGLFADVGWLELVGFVVLVVGMACYFMFGTVTRSKGDVSAAYPALASRSW